MELGGSDREVSRNMRRVGGYVEREGRNGRGEREGRLEYEVGREERR